MRGPERLGRIHKKTIIREYTDATFTAVKARPPRWEYPGILGPLLRAEVDDTIRVVFKNRGQHPYSLRPHGVLHDKESEGTQYDGGRSSPASSRWMRT